MHPSYHPLPFHVLFVFIDGVGLGAEHPDYNPFCQLDLQAFLALGHNQPWTRSMEAVSLPSHTVRFLDATLEVQGLPQSGTGQATLFTGVNCARIAGRHYGPYPHSRTRPAIAERNIFRQILNLGLPHPEPAAFANAYPDVFFEHAEARNRWTVTTLSCIESRIPIRRLTHVQQGLALTADLTGKAWIDQLKLPAPLISEETAARNLAEVSRQHPFTLFEYFLTDKAGHSQSMTASQDVLQSLDRLLGELMDVLDLSRTLLLITSDHGNLEDLSTKTHTLNPVPFIALGAGARYFQHIASLTDVAPTILNAIQSAAPH